MRTKLLAVLVLLCLAVPAQAQINWFAPRQAGKVWEDRLDELNRQERLRTPEQQAQAEAADKAWNAPLSQADIQETLARNKAEYDSKLRLGKAYADRWLDRTARLERAQRESGREASGPDAGTASLPADTPPATPEAPAGLPFERAPSRTSQAEATVAGNLAGNFSLRFAMADPAAFVRSGKVRKVYESELAARNLPGDTVAGATALMFGVAWELANDRKLSASENAAVLRQATGMLRGAALEDDAARQSQADIALTIAGLWLEEAKARQGRPGQMRELADAVHRDVMKMSGNDMRKREITEEGFVASR